jgi:hypothetical protein
MTPQIGQGGTVKPKEFGVSRSAIWSTIGFARFLSLLTDHSPSLRQIETIRASKSTRSIFEARISRAVCCAAPTDSHVSQPLTLCPVLSENRQELPKIFLTIMNFGIEKYE